MADNKQELREEIAGIILKEYRYADDLEFLSPIEDFELRQKVADQILAKAEPLIRKDERERIALEISRFIDPAIEPELAGLVDALKGEGKAERGGQS